TATLMTLTTTLGGTLGDVTGATISRLTSSGRFDGQVQVQIDTTSAVAGCSVRSPCRRFEMFGPTGGDLTGPTTGGWLSSGFLEGQRIQICDSLSDCGRFKIAIIRGDNKAKDNKLELTAENALPAGWTDGTILNVSVARLAAIATWDDGAAAGTDPNWYVEQRIVLVADLNYTQPLVRQGVKIFPVSTHILSKLQGPLAVEGGVTGADRSLQPGLKLPGEKDGPLFAIGPQPPESKQIDVLNIYNDDS